MKPYLCIVSSLSSFWKLGADLDKRDYQTAFMQYLCFHTTSLAWRPFLILLFLFLFLLSQQYLAFFHQKMCMEFLICAVSTVVTVSAVSRKARLTLTTLTNLHCFQPEKIPHPALTCGPAHATCFHSITVQHMRPLVQDPLCSVA